MVSECFEQLKDHANLVTRENRQTIVNVFFGKNQEIKNKIEMRQAFFKWVEFVKEINQRKA